MSLKFLRPVTSSKWNPTGFSLRVRVCQRLVLCVALIVMLCLLLVLHVPFRNTLLNGVWPRIWEEVGTETILKMRTQMVEIEVGTCADVTCKNGLYRPKTTKADVERRNILFHDSDDLNSNAADLDRWMWKFLPLLDREEKITLLYTLDVLAEVFALAGLDYFLVDGTLLGVVRHHGIIPWDDDIDLAVNGSEWRDIRRALCCVEGFKLIPKKTMHWKFFSLEGSIIRNSPMYRFPFIDLFFYMEDEEYMWALTSYNLQNLLFQKRDVFPLSQAMLDGHLYRIPWSANQLVQRQFGDLDRCVSPSNMHKFDYAIHGEGKIQVSCAKLQHLYPTFTALDDGKTSAAVGRRSGGDGGDGASAGHG